MCDVDFKEKADATYRFCLLASTTLTEAYYAKGRRWYKRRSDAQAAAEQIVKKEAGNQNCVEIIIAEAILKTQFARPPIVTKALSRRD